MERGLFTPIYLSESQRLRFWMEAVEPLTPQEVGDLRQGCLLVKRLRKNILVFKKLRCDKGEFTLANLVIPLGAYTTVDITPWEQDRRDGKRLIGQLSFEYVKHRASEAFVHSIYEVHVHRRHVKYVDLRMEVSEADSEFVYVSESWVKPHAFDPSGISCSAGIHYFLTPTEAMMW